MDLILTQTLTYLIQSLLISFMWDRMILIRRRLTFRLSHVDKIRLWLLHTMCKIAHELLQIRTIWSSLLADKAVTPDRFVELLNIYFKFQH